MSDSVIFKTIGAGTERPFGGYVSEADRTALSRRFMVKGSKNIYLKNSNTLANRPGLKRRGSADSTVAGVLQSVTWDTSLNTIRPLRVANSKLQVESDILLAGTYVWYDLITGLTNTRLIFDTWWDNTAKKDILIFCDGTANLKTWSGGMGILSSTTVNTIVLTGTIATRGFDTASGTVIINGTEYAYTGSSASTLTGVTPDPTAQANGSVVIQKPVTESNTPASTFLCDFIKVVNNQLYCGSDTSRLVYISKNTDFTDFTKSTPRAPGEGDILTLDEVAKGIGVRDGKAQIGTRLAWYGVSFNQITVGTTLSEQTLVDKVLLSPQKGVLRHEFIANQGSDLIYVTQDQQLDVYSTFNNVSQPQFPSLSHDIETELSQEDLTGGHLKCIGDFIYITAPNNGRMWLHETKTSVNANGDVTKEKMWHAPFINNISRVEVIDGVVYGYSNANPQIYQMWDTLQWHDDSPSDEPMPYDSVIAFAYWNVGRFNLAEFDQVYTEGYMPEGSQISGAVVYEYKGETSVQTFIINADGDPPEFYTGDIGISLGQTSLGDNPLGDATSDEEQDQENLSKWRKFNDLALAHVHEYQLRVYATELDSRFEIIAIGTNEVVSEEYATSLRG